MLEVQANEVQAQSLNAQDKALVVGAAVDEREQAMERLTKAAVKFEAFFVAQMMQQMRQSTAAFADEDSAINDEVNQAPLAMADHAVADALSTQRAFGIADMLVRQLSAGLEGASASTSSRNNA